MTSIKQGKKGEKMGIGDEEKNSSLEASGSPLPAQAGYGVHTCFSCTICELSAVKTCCDSGFCDGHYAMHIEIAARFHMDVHKGDLEKVFDALLASKRFLMRRDEMNAEVHLAREVRYSPLTVQAMAECDRLRTILEGVEMGEPERDSESEQRAPEG